MNCASPRQQRRQQQQQRRYASSLSTLPSISSSSSSFFSPQQQPHSGLSRRHTTTSASSSSTKNQQPKIKKNRKPLKLISDSYSSFPEYVVSDHKPVALTCRIRVGEPLKTLVDFDKASLRKRAWIEGRDQSCEFKIAPGAKVSLRDWVGLFKHGFKGLNDYVAWQYAASGEC